MKVRGAAVLSAIRFAFAAAVLSCGGGTSTMMDGSACVVGQSAACICDGGAHGAQTCRADGGFGACLCTSALDGGLDASGPCTSAAMCDDHLYCTGVEQCVAVGTTGADSRGCLHGSPPCAVGMSCNETSRSCQTADGAVDAPHDPCDMDGDGHRAATAACLGDDCDDNDYYRHPQLLEFCTGNLPDGRPAANHDEDCDDCTVYATAIDGDGDLDHDGYPSHSCTNPWLTSSRPACEARNHVTVTDPASGSTRGSVTGDDCNDDPGPVVTVGPDAGDAGLDGGDVTDAADAADVFDASDMGTVDAGPTITGHEINPGQGDFCNGIDDNCNGQIDEGDPGGGGACGTGLAGLCAPGINHCLNGGITCMPSVMPVSESCNGLDDDCNGLVDDGDPGGGATCMTGMSGICNAGTMHCMAGSVRCVQNMMMRGESCNGLDDNCNGQIDEGDPGGGAACGTGLPGICAAGVNHCVRGAVACVQSTTARGETCNGVDDNCDGRTDENDPGGGAGCSTGLPGPCGAGTIHCSAGTDRCIQNVAAQAEVCDNSDNNCNGVVDDLPGANCTYGQSRGCTICGTYNGTDYCNNGTCTYPRMCSLQPVVSTNPTTWTPLINFCAYSACGLGGNTALCGNCNSCFPTGLGNVWTSNPWYGLPASYTGLAGATVNRGTLTVQMQDNLAGTWTNMGAAVSRGAGFNGIFAIPYMETIPCAQHRVVVTASCDFWGEIDTIITQNASPTSFSY